MKKPWTPDLTIAPSTYDISVTTIVRNGEAYIARCMESVISQTLQPVEHLIIDGQSTDRTLAIVKEYQERHPRIRLISEPDRGVSDAFNKAWKNANGTFVCCLNSDDWINPDHLERTTEKLKTQDADIVTTQMTFEDENKSCLIKPNWPELMTFSRWFHPKINHPGMTIRKSLLKTVSGYDEKYQIAMDVDLFYRLLAHKPKIAIIDIPTAHQWDGGISQKNVRLALKEMRQIERNHSRSLIGSWGAYLMRMTTTTFKSILIPKNDG